MEDLHGSIKPISLSPEAPDPLVQIQDNLTRVFDLVLEDRDLSRILLHHSSTLHSTVEQRLQDFYREVSGMIERSLKQGISMKLVRPCDTRLTSYSIIGAVKEVLFQLTSSPQPDISEDGLVSEILEFGMRAILVRPQGSPLEVARRSGRQNFSPISSRAVP